MTPPPNAGSTSKFADLDDPRTEGRFRLLAEAIPQIVWTMRRDGNCDYQNRRWFEYSGMTAEESEGLGWIVAVHPDDRATCRPPLGELSINTPRLEYECRLRRYDGVYRWFLVRAEPICDDEGRVVRWFGTSTDIDDRRRQEDDLQKRNAERLQLAAVAARLGYWDWDLTTDVISWSHSLELISGTSPEQFGVSFENFLGLVHPEDRQRVRDAVAVAIRDGTPYEEEFRVANPDGTYRWGLAKGMVTYDIKGRPLRLSGIDVDVTRRKVAEQQARQSQERFRASVDALLDCFGIYSSIRDDQGQIVDFRIDFVNEPASRDNRLTREQQIGRRLLEVRPEHRRSPLFDAYRRVVETGLPFEVSNERLEATLDGAPIVRYFDARIARLGDGFVATWRDVTPRTLAEWSVARELEFQRKLMTRSPAIVYLFDLKTRLMPHIAGGFLSTLGYPEHEIHDHPGQILTRLMHPEDLARFHERLTALNTLADNAEEQLDYRLLHADGNWRWFTARHAIFERDSQGAPRSFLGAALDVTDPKLSQARLATSEERFRATFENAAVGMAHVGLDGRWIRVNERLCEIVGHDRSHLMEISFQDITYPEDLAADLDLLAQLLAGSIPHYTMEKRYFRSDGSITWANLTVSCLRDPSGQPVSFISVVEDINERKAAEARSLLGHQVGGLAIAEIDYATDEVHLGPDAHHLFGLKPGETTLTRDAVHAMFHPDDREELHRKIRASLDPDGDGCFAMEHRVARPDGEVRWHAVRKQVTFAGVGPARRASRSLLAIRDVTDAKRAEQAIRDSEQHLRRVLDNVLAFVGVLTPEGKLIEVNRTALMAGGLRDEDVLGKNFWDAWWWSYSPEVQDRLKEAIRKAAGGEPSRFDVLVRMAGGRLMNIDFLLSPMIDAQGQVTHLIPSGFDVDTRTQAEESLRQADRQKDQFLAMLAHELRNPLAAMRSSLLILNSDEPDPEDRAGAIEVANRQSGHLVRLVDDLLDVARLSTGKILLRRQPLDGARLAEEAAATVAPFVRSRGQDLTVSVERPLPIDGDPTRVEQILTNLLNNASKYTPEGGRIWLEATSEGDEVVFRVRDNGLGLEKEMLSRVFGLFEQIESSLNRSQGGLGIGLMLVKSMAEMHGGQVTAQSDGPGRGSEFTVRLPRLNVVQPGTPSPPRDDTPSATIVTSRTVLLVDDNVDTLRTTARILELKGHRVFRAQSGREALEVAAEHRPEVVILDIGLPDMSGFEVAESMRTDIGDHALLIALTGYTQDNDLKRSRAAGFDHHFSKPVDLDTLLAHIADGPPPREPAP